MKVPTTPLGVHVFAASYFDQFFGEHRFPVVEAKVTRFETKGIETTHMRWRLGGEQRPFERFLRLQVKPIGVLRKRYKIVMWASIELGQHLVYLKDFPLPQLHITRMLSFADRLALREAMDNGFFWANCPRDESSFRLNAQQRYR